MRKFLKITRYLFILSGTFLFFSPSVFTWYTSNYSRYIAMINGPWPFSKLGSAPFIIGSFGVVELTALIMVSLSYLLKRMEELLHK